MASAGGLTEEQKRRMEENRQKALLRRAQRITTSVTNAHTHSKKDSATNKSSSVGTASVDFSKKFPKSKAVDFHLKDNGGNNFNSRISGNQMPAKEAGFKASSFSSKSSGPESVQCLNKHSSLRVATTYTTTTTTTNNVPMSSMQNLPNSASAVHGANPTMEGTLQEGCIQPSSNPAASIHKPKTITSFYSAKPKPSSSSGTASASAQVGCSGKTDTKAQTVNQVNQQQQKAATHRSQFKARTDNQMLKRSDTSVKGGATKPNFGGGQGSSTLSGNCVLISRSRFVVDVSYNSKLIEIFKEIPSKKYDAVDRKWSFGLSDYDTLIEAVRTLRPVVEIEPLPKAVCAAFRRQRHGWDGKRVIPDANLTSVDEKLTNTLMNFQREGVNFAVCREGRVLIADDMGLGKTLQAICIACYYRMEWPVLVVSPSSVRYAWAEAFEKWVPSLSPDDINVVVNSKSPGTSGQVNILSYDLMHRKAQELVKFRFQVVIMDECHFLKNIKTARTKAALPLLKAAPRVILLSGTPALSRPSELYTQILGVAPRLFPSFHEYAVRYCNAVQNAWGWDYSGSSNMTELQLLLEECIMIRRLKQDVLKELPSKTRQMVLMDPSVVKTSSKSLKSAADQMDKNKSKSEERGILLKYFAETGLVKAPAIRDYVLDLLEAGHKFLIFAHHRSVLDILCNAISQKKHDYIRIDGSTTALQRKACCDKFQNDDTCRVAVLSITAANAGLTLTSASMVVFAELFWNPGILIQAEDRVHRIGQEDSTTIRYLIAKGTADDYIWPLVQNKLSVLGKAGLSKDDFSDADTTALKDPRQKSILSFFEKSFLEDDEASEQEDLACLVAMESQESDNLSDSELTASKRIDANYTELKPGNNDKTSDTNSVKGTSLTGQRKACHGSDVEKMLTKTKNKALMGGSENTKCGTSVTSSTGKHKTLFSTPWASKKPLAESNGSSVQEPPSKRQKNTQS